MYKDKEKMGDELPILKGILNGVVNYHNAPVRFGRVPKREKARILAAMQQSTNSRSQEKAVAAELEDEQRLLGTVIRAHLDTCDFTKDKIEPMIARAREQPSYTACPPTLACPLNPNPQPLSGQQELLQDFSKRFSPAIRGVVEFAKRIPGFSLLPQDDQVTLLKAGVFEVLLVRLACMFDSVTNSMICLNGQVLKRESIHNSSNAQFLMDSMFDFAERINSLELSDAEIGLFCSVVVIAPDRPGLRNTDLIERMHNKLRNSLQAVVSQNHPGHTDICNELMKKIPDLRTLNTLHSEKLLAFKMTEQQQLQQQQLQQEIWADEEGHSKSPAGSSWSSSSDVTMDEAVKSPLGSVSSTESMCSGEVANLTDHQNGPASSTPLLAATLAGGICPHRNRANSGSTSGDDDMMGSQLLQNGLTITTVRNPSKSYNQSHRFQRKLDSPSDSGIESGTEKIDKVTNSVNSAPTSLCSSPRSSLEDKDEDKHHNHIVEDMPVLKRVLQAPPLYDTNSLMDEAYKPHKKFRALRNKESAEAEPMIVVSPVPTVKSPEHHSSPQLHRHLTATTSAPPTLIGSHPSLSSSLISPLSSSHSTLISTLNSNNNQSSGSSLSSTHSTLAKSLMEGPRMTAEQVKRQEIIHKYIMRGEPSAEFPCSGSISRPTNNLLNCGGNGSQPQTGYHYLPTQPQPSRWHSNGASVITTSRPFSLTSNNTSSPPPVLQKALEQPNGEFSRIYLQPQSPHLATSSTSPSPLARNVSPSSCSPIARSPSVSGPPMGVSSPKMMELQVDIADSNQQPLNLSKKSPSPSPRPLSATSTAVQKALTLEA